MNTPTLPINKVALISSLLERIEVLVAQNAGLAAQVVELKVKPGPRAKTPTTSNLAASKDQHPSLPSIPKQKADPRPGTYRLPRVDPTHQNDVLAVSD